MNNTLKPEQESATASELAREKRKSESNGEETSGSDEPGTLREKVMAARQAKAKELSGSKTGEDELTKQASARVLDFLWGLMASVIGFIISLFALNAIAFIKAIALNLFGLEKKIKLRLGDKVGIGAVDFLVLVCLIIIVAIFMVILEMAHGIFGWFISVVSK